MNVLIGASLAWILIGAALGTALFMLTVKGIVWPFVLVALVVIGLVKHYGCSVH
jgi:hypothetical protein